MSNLKSSCSFRFPPSTLPWHLRSAFLLDSAYELLGRYGEASPHQTRLFIRAKGKKHTLTQFMQLEENITLTAEGPYAAQISGRLPEFVRQRVSETEFDEDGYCSVPQHKESELGTFPALTMA